MGHRAVSLEAAGSLIRKAFPRMGTSKIVDFAKGLCRQGSGNELQVCVACTFQRGRGPVVDVRVEDRAGRAVCSRTTYSMDRTECSESLSMDVAGSGLCVPASRDSIMAVMGLDPWLEDLWLVIDRDRFSPTEKGRVRSASDTIEVCCGCQPIERWLRVEWNGPMSAATLRDGELYVWVGSRDWAGTAMDRMVAFKGGDPVVMRSPGETPEECLRAMFGELPESWDFMYEVDR